jgi:hypothetical protein
MLVRFHFSSKQAEETGKLTCKNAPQYVSQPSPEGIKMVEYPAKVTPYLTPRAE